MISHLRKSEAGAGLADYLIIIILLALVGLTAARLFGFSLLRETDPSGEKNPSAVVQPNADAAAPYAPPADPAEGQQSAVTTEAPAEESAADGPE